jgi:hypothetical protein
LIDRTPVAHLHERVVPVDDAASLQGDERENYQDPKGSVTK